MAVVFAWRFLLAFLIQWTLGSIGSKTVQNEEGAKSMRKLLTACVALIVTLGVVCGNFWHKMQSAREQIVDLQRQLDEAKISNARLKLVQSSEPTIQTPAAPVGVPAPNSAAPVAAAALPQPVSNEQVRRTGALMRSERTATARALAWSNVLNLTPEQSQELKTIAMAELRREAEESLDIESRNGGAPIDARTSARLKMEAVNRQQQTLTRIHELMKPQLTPEQSNKMGSLFEAWLERDRVRARAEQEQAAKSGY